LITVVKLERYGTEKVTQPCCLIGSGNTNSPHVFGASIMESLVYLVMVSG